MCQQGPPPSEVPFRLSGPTSPRKAAGQTRLQPAGALAGGRFTRQPSHSDTRGECRGGDGVVLFSGGASSNFLEMTRR